MVAGLLCAGIAVELDTPYGECRYVSEGGVLGSVSVYVGDHDPVLGVLGHSVVSGGGLGTSFSKCRA